MLLKIDLTEEDKKLFDQVQVDIQGVKVDDPTAFIAIRYANKTTAAMSSDTLLPVTDLDKYATEEHAEPTEPVKEPEGIKLDNITTYDSRKDAIEKGNAGKSPKKPASN